MKKSIFLLVALCLFANVGYAQINPLAVKYPSGVTVGDNLKLRGYLALTAEVVSPASLATVAISAATNYSIFASSATVGTVNIVLPAVTNLADGFMKTLSFIPTYTVVAISAADSTTIVTAPTTATALSSIRFMYVKAKAKWYKI